MLSHYPWIKFRFFTVALKSLSSLGSQLFPGFTAFPPCDFLFPVVKSVQLFPASGPLHLLSPTQNGFCPPESFSSIPSQLSSLYKGFLKRSFLLCLVIFYPLPCFTLHGITQNYTIWFFAYLSSQIEHELYEDKKLIRLHYLLENNPGIRYSINVF